LLVTVGTDGFTDWVQLPDGSKLSLGPVSVLNFISKLCPSGRKAKHALDVFLKGKPTMLPVDEDQMWAMLTPRRARWAADSFMARDQRTTPTSRGTTMSTIDPDLTAIEKHLVALEKAAAAGTPPEKMTEGFKILTKLASRVTADHPPAYFGLGGEAPTKVAGDEEAAPAASVEPAAEPASASGLPQPDPPTQGLTYDIYTANTESAEEILAQAEVTVDKIDKLVEAGKKFNAAKAKADIHTVTSKVAGILTDTDLTAPWVAEDLQKLAARCQELHDLFPKEV